MKVLFLLPRQTLTFPARALSVTEVRCTFDGVCSSLVLHRFPNLRDVGGNKCHYVECSFFFFFFFCLRPVGLRWAQFLS